MKLYFYGRTRRLRNSVPSNFKARISFIFVHSSGLWHITMFFKFSGLPRKPFLYRTSGSIKIPALDSGEQFPVVLIPHMLSGLCQQILVSKVYIYITSIP